MMLVDMLFEGVEELRYIRFISESASIEQLAGDGGVAVVLNDT